MGNFSEVIFPINTVELDPNLRSENPIVGQIVKIDPAAMVTGVITVNVASPFGKGRGEVFGVYPLNTIASANEVIGLSAAAHSTTAGQVTITINSTSAVSTTNLGAFYVILIGRILPVAV